MRIAIPIIDILANKNTLASGLNVNGYLCLFDNENKSTQWIKTMELAPDISMLLNELERKSVSVIITEQIHPFALKVLVNKGFDVFQAVNNVLDDNIQYYNKNMLMKFKYDTAMTFASSCGGVCDSCVTECSDDKKVLD